MISESDKAEILEAIGALASHMDERFNAVDRRFEGVDRRLDSMDLRFDRMDERFDRMDVRIGHIENVMVTKDYLDEKLADQRGDLVVLMRKEDRKLGVLVSELLKRNVLDQESAERILSLEPFSR